MLPPESPRMVYPPAERPTGREQLKLNRAQRRARLKKFIRQAKTKLRAKRGAK